MLLRLECALDCIECVGGHHGTDLHLLGPLADRGTLARHINGRLHHRLAPHHPLRCAGHRHIEEAHYQPARVARLSHVLTRTAPDSDLESAVEVRIELLTCRDVAADVSSPPEVVLLSAVLVNVLTDSALESAVLIGTAADVATDVAEDWLPELAIDVPLELLVEATTPVDAPLLSDVEQRTLPDTDLESAFETFTLSEMALESATLMLDITASAVEAAVEMLPAILSAVLRAVETAVERR